MLIANLQVAGVRSNLWQGAAAVASGAAFTNVYVGWGVKTERFLPLPPPPVAQEYDQVRLPAFLRHDMPHNVQSVCARVIVGRVKPTAHSYAFICVSFGTHL